MRWRGWFVFLAGFFLLSYFYVVHGLVGQVRKEVVTSRVMLEAPLLVTLFAGEKNLASNFEIIRLAASGASGGVLDYEYLLRAHNVVAKITPCSEDNYYFANGLLGWGGYIKEGNDVLLRAAKCRYWDGVPFFFLGMNKVLFERDVDGAVRDLQRSAERWPENYAALMRLALTLRADKFDDARLARQFLVEQKNASKNLDLKEMLAKRINRLEGLIVLRSAKEIYEQRHGLLRELHSLVDVGILKELPNDPLGIGYELKDGVVVMGRLQVMGLGEN